MGRHHRPCWSSASTEGQVQSFIRSRREAGKAVARQRTLRTHPMAVKGTKFRLAWVFGGASPICTGPSQGVEIIDLIQPRSAAYSPVRACNFSGDQIRIERSSAIEMKRSRLRSHRRLFLHHGCNRPPRAWTQRIRAPPRVLCVGNATIRAERGREYQRSIGVTYEPGAFWDRPTC